MVVVGAPRHVVGWFGGAVGKKRVRAPCLAVYSHLHWNSCQATVVPSWLESGFNFCGPLSGWLTGSIFPSRNNNRVS